MFCNASGDVVNGVWTGAQDSFWTNANNWAGGVVPGRYRAADSAGNVVTNGDGLCSATFGAGASASFSTINLDGLASIATVVVENASMTITFGTDTSQKLPIENNGLFKVAPGAKTPVIAASMPYAVWVPYSYWSVPSGKPKPGIEVQNYSDGTLVLGTMCQQERVPELTSNSELDLILRGTGSFRIDGTTTGSGSGGLHIYHRIKNPAKLVIATNLSVRDLNTNADTTLGEALVEIERDVVLQSANTWYGLFTINRKTRIYGGGTIRTTVAKGTVSGVTSITDALLTIQGELIVETPFEAKNNSSFPSVVAGMNLTGNSNGIIEFKDSVSADGPIWIGSCALRTPNIGADGDEASFGRGTPIVMNSNGKLLYSGPGETTTRTVVITNTSARQLVTSPNAVYEHAGSGVWIVNSAPTINAGSSLSSATLTLANSTVYGAVFSAVLTNGPDGILNIEKSGTGTWRLTAANTYTGTTTLNAGTLEIAPGASVSASSSINMKGGTLKFDDGDEAVSYSLPSVSLASGASTIYAGANTTISIAGISRTGSSTLNIIAENRPVKITIAGMADGAVPSYIKVNGAATTYSAEDGLAIPELPGSVRWEYAVDGEWSDGTKWVGGEPPTANEGAVFNAYGQSYAVSVTSPVTMGADTSLSIHNNRGGDVATLAVSNAIVSTATNGIAVRQGGKILFGEGGSFKYDNSSFTAVGYVKTFMNVSDGGELVIDGGNVVFTNINGYVDVNGIPGTTSTVRLVSGELTLSDHDHASTGDTYTGGGALRIQSGGRFEQTGGTNSIASFMNGGCAFGSDDGCEMDISGNSRWHISNGIYRDTGKDIATYLTFSGTTRFRDNAILDAYPGTPLRIYVAPQKSGNTAVLEFLDHAKLDSARRDVNFYAPNITVGGKPVKGYSYLRFLGDAWHHESSKQGADSQHWRTAGICMSVGDLFGYGELEVADGVVASGLYGFRVGCRWQHTYYVSAAPACVTGVVRVTGGVLRTSSNINVAPGWWATGSSFEGDQIGTSAGYSADEGFYYGRMEVDVGAYTNTRSALTIGYGRGIGEWFQRGGRSVICSDKTGSTNGKPSNQTTDFHHYNTNHVFSIGLAGGTGSFTQTGGEVIDNLRTYVGGTPFAELTPYCEMHEQYGNSGDQYSASINDYISRGYGDRHGATGYLGILGGTFTADHAIYVGKDGTGVLEIGPTGSLSAASIVLANNEYTAVGTSAATLKFTFDETGIGTAEVTNFVVASGSSLVVDMRDYDIANSARSRFRLLKAANVEGTFDKSNVTLLLPDENLASRVNLDCTAGGIEVKLLRGSVIILR